jgi:hypothetical protein
MICEMCKQNNKTSVEGRVILPCSHINDNTKNKTKRKVMLVYKIQRSFKQKKYCEDYQSTDNKISQSTDKVIHLIGQRFSQILTSGFSDCMSNYKIINDYEIKVVNTLREATSSVQADLSSSFSCLRLERNFILVSRTY